MPKIYPKDKIVIRDGINKHAFDQGLSVEAELTHDAFERIKQSLGEKHGMFTADGFIPPKPTLDLRKAVELLATNGGIR